MQSLKKSVASYFLNWSLEVYDCFHKCNLLLASIYKVYIIANILRIH